MQCSTWHFRAIKDLYLIYCRTAPLCMCLPLAIRLLSTAYKQTHVCVFKIIRNTANLNHFFIKVYSDCVTHCKLYIIFQLLEKLNLRYRFPWRKLRHLLGGLVCTFVKQESNLSNVQYNNFSQNCLLHILYNKNIVVMFCFHSFSFVGINPMPHIKR